MQKDLVRQAFDSLAPTYAPRWTDAAQEYPLVRVRSEYAARWFREHLPPADAALLDLGCGPGYLLELLAEAGYRVHGIDLAPQMVEESRRRLASRGFLRDRVTLEVGDATAWQPPHLFNGVAALGVLEYLPADSALFGAASRCLAPAGRLMVECRNRLFNLVSLNRYTREVLREGEYEGLLREYEELLASPLLRPFGSVAANLVTSVQAAFASGEDVDQAAPRAQAVPHGAAAYAGLVRRQHTPLGLAAEAERYGFRMVYLRFLHFHPFPPTFEGQAAKVFRRLGMALEVLGDTPVAAPMSSSFLAGFEKTRELPARERG